MSIPPNNPQIYKTSTSPQQPTQFKNIPVVQPNIQQQSPNAPKPITNPYISQNTNIGGNPVLTGNQTYTQQQNITNRTPSSPPLNINQPTTPTTTTNTTTNTGMVSPMTGVVQSGGGGGGNINSPTTSNNNQNPNTPGGSTIDSTIDSLFKKHSNSLVGHGYSPISNISSPGLGNHPNTPPPTGAGNQGGSSGGNTGYVGPTYGNYQASSTSSSTGNTITTTTTGSGASGSVVTLKSKKQEKERKEKEQRDREATKEAIEREQRERDYQQAGGRMNPDSNELLGKRKLSELLSQISTEEKMDEEVEEILSIIADDFVEQVSSFACSLAKHRNSTTLEVKDLQCHLERAWNIKIPGFGNPEQIKSYKKPHYPDSHKLRIQTMKKAIQLNQSLTRKHMRLTEQQQQMNRE